MTETAETLATCKPRIVAAIDDLENTMATFEEQEEGQLALLKETPEWTQAVTDIAEAKAFVENMDL